MLYRAFALVLVVSAGTCSAQWVAGGSFSVFNHFHASAFHTADTGLFVYGTDNPNSGEGGIIATYDGLVGGGFYLYYRSPMNLEDIHVVESNGFPYYMAAGYQGSTWSVVVKPYELFLNPYQFDSVRTGMNQQYRAIRMRSDLVAFAGGVNSLGNGVIDMSSDTGATWTQVTELIGQPVSRLHFVNDQLGFASTGGYRRLVGNGVQVPDSGAVYRTQDGGMSWQQVLSSTVTGFSSVAFGSVLNGVATRNDGVIMRTTDGGTNWTSAIVNVTLPVILTSSVFRPDGTAFAGGYKADGSEGLILISTDGGASWEVNFSTAGLNHSRRVYGLTFFDNATGIASTHIRPLKTTGLITSVEARAGAGFSLYPVPATDRIHLVLEEPAASIIRILDPLGRIVREHSSSGSGNMEIPVDDLARGHYTVVVQSGTGRYGRRILLQ